MFPFNVEINPVLILSTRNAEVQQVLLFKFFQRYLCKKEKKTTFPFCCKFTETDQSSLVGTYHGASVDFMWGENPGKAYLSTRCPPAISRGISGIERIGKGSEHYPLCLPDNNNSV